MKPGDKIYIEVTIDEKVENHQGIYYSGHVEQFSVTGARKSSIKIQVVPQYDKLGGLNE